MESFPNELRSATIAIFPHWRMIGTARNLLDLATVKTDDEMNAIWERLMDDLEAQMIRCGADVEERALQLHALYKLVQCESHRRAYEGSRYEPIEAA